MNRTSLRTGSVILAIIGLALFLICGTAFSEGEVSLLFINVGKGDACLIQADRRNYLLDTGKKDAHEQLMEVLSQAGAENLDGVILSHTDKDHCGGLKKLLKNGPTVTKLYCGKEYLLDPGEDHPVIEAAEKYGKEIVWLEKGQSIELGSNAVFRIIGPLVRNEEDENNNSLVMVLETPYGKALFTGDMEREEEQSLIAAGLIEGCDVLKVAHHGQYTGGSRNFYLLTKPKIAIISTDRAEETDSADARVVSNLWDVGAEVLITEDVKYGYRVIMNENGISYSEFGTN